jgi:hypothetical protein
VLCLCILASPRIPQHDLGRQPLISEVVLSQLNWSHAFSLFFGQVTFKSAQLVSSAPFPFLGAASPQADVITLLHCVTLPSQWAKTTLLPLFHLLAMLCLVASSLDPKLKHWIRTTAAGYPARTAQFPPTTIIKDHLNLGHSPHHPTTSPFCLLPSQSTTPSELQPPLSFPFTAVSRPLSLRTMTPTVMN